MKKLRQIITEIKLLYPASVEQIEPLLWQYICYSPKMPARLQQQQLLDTAETIALTVTDEYFAQKELSFNAFRWGNGKHKILLTHGWGSKAIDFSEIITALSRRNDFEIIAFDAPGNGSSEGELSNLLLYIQAVKAVVLQYGKPDIVIGHSLGAMANVVALTEMNIQPTLLVSLTPLLRLKENFEYSMDAIGISDLDQTNFLNSFQEKFGFPASKFTFSDYYHFGSDLDHWLAYDVNDQISPYSYLADFLEYHPSIKAKDYADLGHDRIIKSPIVISDLLEQVMVALS
ncbi:MAG: alpha/beta fold hydrolase [Mucilaginibacter sp.]